MTRSSRPSAPIVAAICVSLAAAAASLVAIPTSFTDAFDRADNGNLGNAWSEVQGDLLVQSNELRNAAGIAGSAIAVAAANAGDRQTASALFASTSNNSIPVLGLVLHYESPQSYYALYRLAGGTSVLRIVAVANGQETILAQAGIPNPTENRFFRLSASADAGTLSVTLEGVKTLTVSDSRIPAGRVGILMGTKTTNASLRVSHRADDFAAEITTTEPPPPAPRLRVSLSSAPAPQSVPAGTPSVVFANVVLDAAGSAEDVAVASLELALETDVGQTSPDACRLVDESNSVINAASVVEPAGDGAYAFAPDGDLVVPIDSQRTLKLVCDVPPGAAGGDMLEWRLASASSVVARGVGSSQAATIEIQASADNANRVTVQSGTGGTGAVDISQLRSVLRAGEISLGPDLGEQAPPLSPHTAINFEGTSPPATAWLTVSDPVTRGDGTICADMIDSEINGEQCGGVAALVTDGASGRAIVARSCDAKGTDTLRVGVLDTSTGAVTPLVSTSLFGRIDTYGGSNPPANCDHNRGQPDYHMYCQWVRTCLTVISNSNGSVTLTATSWLRGSGPKNDPSRNEPTSPSLTQIGVATWTGARPTGVAATGKIGLVGTATQGWERLSLTNLRVEE